MFDDTSVFNDGQTESAGVGGLTRLALTTLQSLLPGSNRRVNHAEAHRLRARILGVLLRQGRLAAELTQEDCAEYLKVDPREIEAWELGASVPSLPQLEEISSCFKASSAGEAWSSGRLRPPQNAEYSLLRQRLVGGLLQSARWASDASYEDISAKTGIETDLLVRYEFGEATIPVHHLTVLAGAVKRDLGYFMESAGVKHRPKSSSSVTPASANDEDADLLQLPRTRRIERLSAWP